MNQSPVHSSNPVQQQPKPLDVVVIGGGMITHDQILPSLYHLQRLGQVGSIAVCDRSSGPLQALASDPLLAEAFPGQRFDAFPPLDTPPEEQHPDLYREVVGRLAPYQLVVVAVPDQLHASMVRCALEHHQHVLCVKPLVRTFAEAAEIERLATSGGLMVGVEYHKRFDRRSLEARLQYRRGRFGQFRMGEAKMIEPYFYRHSNFQNWFTKENSDPFTYVGCHYVDLVYFITGLRPVEVSVRGIEGTFPNGNVGYLWSHGRVVWENGAILSLINGLGYPDQAAGTNDQCLVMYCEGDDAAALIDHDDHFRGASYSYLDQAAGATFRFISPDYFRLVPWCGEGLRPIGYGYESIEAITQAAAEVNRAADGLEQDEALQARRDALRRINEQGILATPGNSYVNELVIEAARLSIAELGRPAVIRYGDSPSVALR